MAVTTTATASAPGRRFWRPPTLDVDELVAEARDDLDRLSPADASAAIEAGALLVDIRPEGQRRREGEFATGVLIDRNVLEWRLDPRSPHRIAELESPDQIVIVACSAGFASSLAAASLQRLGLHRATDLVGGFLAWDAAGLPSAPFDIRAGAARDRTAPRGNRPSPT